MLNPSNAPIFVFQIVKNLDSDDKKNLEECYKKIVELEIKMIALDMNYLEKGESDFIKESYKEWQEVKKLMNLVHSSIVKNWNNGFKKKEKGYFG